MDYLIHYGIKGQKWGERRFQNEDGTLTPAGKSRYSKTLDYGDYIDESNRKHPESAGGGEEPEDDMDEDDENVGGKKKKKKRKSGGHHAPEKEKSFMELVSEERQRRLEKKAKKKVEAAVQALDELNKESVHGEKMKRKRLGEQRRFGTDKLIVKNKYSFESFVNAGKEHMRRSMSKK